MCLLNRPQRVSRSPGPQPAGRTSPGNAVTSMVSIKFCLVSSGLLEKNVQAILRSSYISQFQLSPSFTPTSVIRKMYATKEKSKDELSGRSEPKEEATANSQDGTQHLLHKLRPSQW